jgi:Uma2 family endonuclease
MVTAIVEPHHWTREEYERMVEAGAFEGAKVELIEGTLYEVTPQTSRHAGLTAKISEILAEVDPGEHLLRQYSPLSVPGDEVSPLFAAEAVIPVADLLPKPEPVRSSSIRSEVSLA